MVLVIFGALTAVFFLLNFAPGNPFETQRGLSEQAMKEKLRQYKMDGTAVECYGRYLKDLVQGDMRMSLTAQQFSVAEILRGALPISFRLGGTAFLLAAGGGILAGAFAASRSQRFADRATQVAATAMISTPTFITGPLLALIFALLLGWFPIGGWGSWQHVVLPSVCLALYFGANVARLMRNSMVEVLNMPYIRTARAKGLTESAVVGRHALRVAITPVISYLGPMAAYLLTGSMIVESVFAIPGMGQHFVNATLSKDVFLLLGAVLVYCCLVVLFNIAADLVLCLVDPRVKLDGRR